MEKRKITSVLLHVEQIETVLGAFDDNKLGCLMRCFLEWCFTGKEYDGEDGMLRFAFLTLKTQAKLDFAKYDVIVERRREAGKKGGLKRVENLKQNQANQANATKCKQNQANQADNDNDNDNDNDINICVNAENADKSATHTKTLDERRNEFYKKLIPYVERYGKEMIRSFYNYWSQVNEGGKKMLCEKQKAFEISRRLETWSTKEYSKKTSEQNDNKLYRNQTKEDFEQAKTKKLI